MANPTPQHPAAPTSAPSAPGEAATNPQQPAASTALAKVRDPLSPAAREQVHLRGIQENVSAEIARLTWGKELEEYTRKALAAWGEEHSVDVITEVDMLGGKLYLNSHYFIRRLSDLVGAGLVDYVSSDFCHADKRLDRLAGEGDSEAKEERDRREKLRIRYGIPDEATGACTFRVKLHALSREVVGINWAGGGTGNHKANGKGDPVGEKEPVKTAESRAARRCVRLLVSHMPEQAKAIEAVVKDLDTFAKVIDKEQKQLAADSTMRPTPAVHDDGYGAPPRAKREPGGAIPVEVIDQSARPVNPGRFAGLPDPYLPAQPQAEPPALSEEESLALDRELEERERTG